MNDKLFKERRIFNHNREKLCSKPGLLNVYLTDTGHKFDIDIKQPVGLGIGYMKVFCHNLTLIKFGKNKSFSPGLLIHNSNILNGVEAGGKRIENGNEGSWRK